MHVIAIASQKGGVGKTTISLNLGLALARAGNRTVILELDAQGSLGLSLGLNDRARAGIAEVLTGAETVESALIHTRDPQLHVLSVGRVDPTTVSGFEEALTRPSAIVNIMKALEKEFDIVLIDCPAGLREGGDAGSRSGDARARAAPGRASGVAIDRADAGAHRSHQGGQEPEPPAPRDRALDVRSQGGRVARRRGDALDSISVESSWTASSRGTRSSSRHRFADRRFS